jgi:hypothetical protein
MGGSQASWIQVDVQFAEAGEVRFWYKVSSEVDHDHLQFRLDGQLQDEWSGEVDWSQAIYAVGAGDHTLRWTYDKDITTDDGSDKGWIDHVELDVGIVP